MTTAVVENTIIVDTPLEAIERVFVELTLHPSDREEMITRDEMLGHLRTLCEGFECNLDSLPEPFATMADTAYRRGEQFHFQRSRVMDLLYAEMIRHSPVRG